MYALPEMDFYDYEEKDFDTIIESDISFTGQIRFKKPLMIRGTGGGEIVSNSDLVLDRGSSVSSNIGSDRVLVRGRVEGNIDAERIAIVTATGTVLGNITSRQIVLEPGNSMTGFCRKAAP
jgi:cytoskeletal protein CcmA (bactofilin family)